MPCFTIIIPNWNGEQFLKGCLDSLCQQTLQDFQVIVVDNHSTDNSVALIKKQYPQVSILEQSENTGFAYAVNVGIKAATSPLIALLNNDTEADPQWLEALKTAADSHPEATFFASKMLDFNERHVIDSCGNGMSWSGKAYKIAEGETDGPELSTGRFVFGACAGAAAYRSELFQNIGLFDEEFVTYLEDVDLDFRAQLAGLRCFFVPAAKVYHLGSATSGKGSVFGFRMGVKNHFHLVYKNYPSQMLWKSSGKLLYAELRLLAAAIRNRYLLAYVQGVWAAVRQSPSMRRKRKLIQTRRIVSIEYLETVIDSRFHFKSLHRAIRGK